jgi:hypothetical protein
VFCQRRRAVQHEKGLPDLIRINRVTVVGSQRLREDSDTRLQRRRNLRNGDRRHGDTRNSDSEGTDMATRTSTKPDRHPRERVVEVSLPLDAAVNQGEGDRLDDPDVSE